MDHLRGPATRILDHHPRTLAAGLGLLSACGFAPLGLWPLTLLALAGLIALIARAQSAAGAAWIGALFGLGQFALALNWIAAAFTYQAALPPWLGWAGVVAVALYLAPYTALAALAAWWLRCRFGAAPAPALAGCWILCEWLRGWFLIGFAWNPLGAVLLGGYGHAGAAEAASVTGTYGLSGLAVLLAGCWHGALAAALRRRAAAALALALIPAAAMLLPGPAPAPGPRGIAFTLVQPDIPQQELNDPAHYEDSFGRLAALSSALPGAGRRLLLWPESGVPDYLRDGYPLRYYLDTYGADPALARRRLGRLAGAEGLLLSGTTDLEMAGGRAAGAHNAVTALDAAGAIRGSYAKAHLVPFGEYLPLRGLLTPLGLARFVPGDIDFRPGPGPRTLDLGPWGKVGVQICYEIVFPGAVTDRAHRPDFIFNPSNDGWFGSWGPPQHLAQARLRAIEEGLPVLRVTTNGISAVIDARGRVEQAVPPRTAGRLDGHLPAPLPPTLFARLGNLLSLGMGVVLLGLSVVARRRREG